MDEKKRARLEALGWPSEILDSMKPTPEKEAVRQKFLEGTREALTETGYSALEFLTVHPSVPVRDLSDLLPRVNKWVSGHGLVMAIYDDASENNLVREVAKDLLIRAIHYNYPNGWFAEKKIHALVKLGFWSDEIADCFKRSDYGEFTRQIMRHLTIDNPPPEGWKPQPENDPLIDELFNRYWPNKNG